MQTQTVGTYGYEYNIKHTKSLRQISTDVKTFTIDRGYCYTKHDTIFRAMLLYSTFIFYIGSRKFTIFVILNYTTYNY